LRAIAAIVGFEAKGEMFMKPATKIVIAAVGLAMLGACGGGEGEGGVTAEESRQLNEAAEMLDASPDSLTAGNDAMLGEEAETAPAPAEDANIAVNAQ
jgi:hypothetical protein